MFNLPTTTTIFLLLLSLVFNSLPAQSLYCWIDVNNDLGDRQPLLLQENSNEFLYPRKPGWNDIKFGFCEKLRVACPDDRLVIFGSTLNVSEATLQCYGFSYFNVVDTGYVASIDDITCSRLPVTEASLTNSTCANNGTIAQIGFRLPNSVFVPTIEQICHNETLGRTYWAHSKVSYSVCKRQHETGSPKYVKEPFYPSIIITPATYSKDEQRKRLQLLLNNSTLVDMYIPAIGDNYLVETQLAPRSDMFYKAQQDSVYNYVNTVPAWKNVRDGNWRLIEDIIRKVSCRQANNFDLWTGGIDVLTDNSATGNATEITLTTNNAMQPAIPVPRFLFKYVIDRVHNTGIVFITLNNPYVAAITQGEQICQEYKRCNDLYPQFSIATRGYAYCCLVDDFANKYAVKLGLPKFTNVKPLF